MDSGKSKKVNTSVISDNVFVILGYLNDHVSKKLYKAKLLQLIVLYWQYVPNNVGNVLLDIFPDKLAAILENHL